MIIKVGLDVEGVGYAAAVLEDEYWVRLSILIYDWLLCFVLHNLIRVLSIPINLSFFIALV